MDYVCSLTIIIFYFYFIAYNLIYLILSSFILITWYEEWHFMWICAFHVIKYIIYFLIIFFIFCFISISCFLSHGLCLKLSVIIINIVIPIAVTFIYFHFLEFTIKILLHMNSYPQFVLFTFLSCMKNLWIKGHV